MYNFFLEYLMKNEPEEVLSKSGIKVRKFINPALRAVAPLTCKYKYKLVRRAEMPKGVPIIYVPTHGFKDDVLGTILTINDSAYILFGSLPQFYNTFDGVTAWLNGTINIDRTDSRSRKASKEKMETALKWGANLIVYPEGVWDKSRNLLVLKLFPGFYNLAIKTGAWVAPVATHLEGDTIYGILDDAIDIGKYSQQEARTLVRDKMASAKWEIMENYSKTTREQILQQTPYHNVECYWQDYLQSLISEVAYYDEEVENSSHYIDKNEVNIEDVYRVFQTMEPTKENLSAVVDGIKVLKLNNQNRYF